MAYPEGDNRLSAMSADITAAVLAFIVLTALLGVYLDELADLYRRLLEWFYSEDWKRINRIMALVFSVINLGLIIFIARVARRHSALANSPPAPQEEIALHAVSAEKEVENSWEHIKNLANSANPSDWNMAVLRADSLLEEILGRLGYEGETLTDKLKIADPTKLTSLDRIWSAHRLRNAIAHEPLEQHTRETIIHALRSYETAFRELGMLEKETAPEEAPDNEKNAQ